MSSLIFLPHPLPTASHLGNLQVFFSAVDGLKKLYKERIKPVEDLYKVI
jgi:hypothetical protein